MAQTMKTERALLVYYPLGNLENINIHSSSLKEYSFVSSLQLVVVIMKASLFKYCYSRTLHIKLNGSHDTIRPLILKVCYLNHLEEFQTHSQRMEL